SVVAVALVALWLLRRILFRMAKIAGRLARDPGAELRRARRDHRSWVALILLGSALLRGWLCLVNPNANDDHLIVAEMIRRDDWQAPAPTACMECSHPKLYHYVAALALEANNGAAATVIGNLINWLAGTVLLGALWLMLRGLGRDLPAGASAAARRAAVLVLAWVAFNPALVGILSQATNDGFSILFSSLTILFLWHHFHSGRLSSVAFATFFAILAAASKASGWLIFAAGAALLLIQLGAARARKQAALALAIFVAGFLAVAPWIEPYRGNLSERGTPFVNDAFHEPAMFIETPRSPSWPIDTFLTFRLIELLQTPYDALGPGPHPQHRESLWSQLYGRSVSLRFDHGIWHNPDPRLHWLARTSLLAGLLPLAALLLGAAAQLRGLIEGVRRAGPGWLAQHHQWHALAYSGAMLAALIALLIQYHRMAILYLWMKVIYLLPALFGFAALMVGGLAILSRRWPRLVALWMATSVALAIIDAIWLALDLT
ncbi:MAG TPA: hypothetical protein VEB21_16670, partial [Terriglobales bacterium]|nr:hypothetical protein [Terriglobales bacterium]